MGAANKPIEETPAQGAGGSSEAAKEVIVVNDQNEVPSWLKAMLESGQVIVVGAPGEDIEKLKGLLLSHEVVIESNKAVVDAVQTFKETAGEIVKELLKELKGAPVAAAEGNTITAAVAQVVELKEGAKYTVANGRGFHDTSRNETYHEGATVKGLAEDKVRSLLAQGVIVEALEEE